MTRISDCPPLVALIDAADGVLRTWARTSYGATSPKQLGDSMYLLTDALAAVRAAQNVEAKGVEDGPGEDDKYRLARLARVALCGPLSVEDAQYYRTLTQADTDSIIRLIRGEK
jgi:hypothetical protein